MREVWVSTARSPSIQNAFKNHTDRKILVFGMLMSQQSSLLYGTLKMIILVSFG